MRRVLERQRQLIISSIKYSSKLSRCELVYTWRYITLHGSISQRAPFRDVNDTLVYAQHQSYVSIKIITKCHTRPHADSTCMNHYAPSWLNRETFITVPTCMQIGNTIGEVLSRGCVIYSFCVVNWIKMPYIWIMNVVHVENNKYIFFTIPCQVINISFERFEP